MRETRSDLALECAESFARGKRNTAKIEGIRSYESRRRGYSITSISVENGDGAEALGKPIGRYVTIDLTPYFQRQQGFFTRGVSCLCEELRTLLPPRGQGNILVAGLGNRAMAADAIGPTALESVLVTRHLPQEAGQFAPVAAIATGVSAGTGMESMEILRAIVRDIGADTVLLIDSLAARDRGRLCNTVQISDTGLVPGSGVGNHRRALNRETIGVPVIAIGVPTVIDAEQLGASERQPLFVTPRDIDSRVREIGRLVGYGVTLALQPQLTMEDVTGLLG